MGAKKKVKQMTGPEKTVKMVVCDLDGTLLNASSRVSSRTQEAIRALRKQGVLFGICSGRSAVALKKMIQVWGIEEDVDFVLGFNGGMFWDPRTGEMEKIHTLDPKDIESVFQACRGFRFGFGEYQGKAMLATKPDFLAAQMARRNRLDLIRVDQKDLLRPALKVMAYGMPWTISRWLKQFDSKTLKTARVFRSGPFLLEFVHPQLSKLEGVARTAKKYGIALDEVLSFGNDNNDLEMLAGTQGVAMANALPAVKKAARFETDSNRKDGVARFLERWILKKQPAP